MKKCGIILQNFNNILLVFGKKSLKWGFPKGHMEPGETEEETAIRELFEETGILLKSLSSANRIQFKNNTYFWIYLKEETLKTCIQDTEEIQKCIWFSRQELKNLNPVECNFGLKLWLNRFCKED